MARSDAGTPRAARGLPRPDPSLTELAVLILALAAGVGLLVALVVGDSQGVDLAGHRALHGTPDGGWTVLARRVTDAGSSTVLYPLLALLAGLLSVQTDWRRVGDALFAAVALGVGSALRFGLSIAVARPRPPGGDWLYPATGFAFPSGHTTNTTITLGILVLLCQRRRRAGRATRAAVVGAWVVAVVGAAAVGWSRVYLGVHWPTDVAAGWAFGTAWVAATAVLAGRITPWRRTDRPTGGRSDDMT